MEHIKLLFNSQYYDQKILRTSKDAIATQPNTAGFWNMCYDSSYLLLRSVNQLTDEEVVNIANMYGWGSEMVTKDRYDERILQFKLDLPCIVLPGFRHKHMKYVFDYLTRIGILLPFTYIDKPGQPITIQPEEIIQRGWAKIKEQNTK